MRSTLVVSLGNLLMTDEGVGVRILEALMARTDLPPGAEFLDSGNSGMRILHSLEGKSRVVLLDCAFMDEPPGTLRVFTPGDVATRKVLQHLSLHEGDLLQTLDLGEKLGLLPKEVLLVGIQPASVGPGGDLSPVLSACFDSCVKTVLSLLVTKR